MYEDLKVEELKDLLRERDLPVSGRKADLIDRLEEHEEEVDDDEEPEEVSLELPVWEGRQVIRILDSRHTKTHFHCKLEGGVTMHVPKRLFEE